MSAQVIDLAGYRAIRKLRAEFTLFPKAEQPPPRRRAPWLQRVTCGACGQRGHTRASCTDWEALRRANEIRERERTAPRPLCGLCRHPGHDRSTCELGEAASVRAKELGINFGAALELLKSEADHG